MTPRKQKQKTTTPAAIRTLKFVREVAVVGAAVTSASVVWSATFYRLIEFLAYRPSIILAAMITALVCITVDYVLRQLFPYVCNLIFSAKWKKNARSKAFVVISAAVCVALTVVTVSLSWHGRVDISEVTMKTPDMVTSVAVKKQLDESTMLKLADIDRDIAKYERAILAKEQDVRQRYPSWVKKVESGSDKYGYAAGQLQKRMDEATENERKELSKLMYEKTELRQRESQIAEAAVDEVAETNANKMTYFETQKARNMAFIGFFGPGCTIIFLIFSVLIELSNLIQYDFEQHSMSSYALSFSDIIPKKAPSPSRSAPDYMPVGDTKSRDRIHEFLEGKVNDLERKIAGDKPSGDRPATRRDKPSGDRPATRRDKPSGDRPATRRDKPSGDRPATRRDKPSGDRSDKAKTLKRLKDRARRYYERGQTESWDAVKATLESRGCTIEYFTNDSGDPRVRIGGGK